MQKQPVEFLNASRRLQQVKREVHVSPEVEKAEEEIRTLGLANYCSVLHFD